MTRQATRFRLSRRSALKLLPVGGAVVAATGLGLSQLWRPAEAQAAGECRICTMRCGFIATTRGDTVVSVKGDPASNTRGFLCEHGKAIPELIHSKERLTRPLKKEGDAFVEIGWEQALAEIGDRLLAVKQKYGPEALVLQTGWPFVRHPMIHLLHRFARAFGTPNLATVASLCEASGRMGRSLVFGSNYSVDLKRVRSVLVWGANPPRTAPPWAYLLTNLKKRGKLVVIDVVKTELAEKANVFVQVRPGTDAAFALGMIRHIINQGLYDRAFVAAEVVGFEELTALAEAWTPERVAEVTGCGPGQVVEVAEIFAKLGPAGIWDGLGIEHHGAGVDTVRLVAALVAICNYADAQSFHEMPDPGAELLPLILGIEQQTPVPPLPGRMPIGFEEYPVFCAVHRQAQASLLPRAILEDRPYPVRALLQFGCNPAVTTPDSQRVKAAYDRLELLVSVDPFLTESGELADYVLPAATFAEQPPLRWGKEAAPRIVAPPGEARPDAEILFALAARVGLGAYFPWNNLIEAFETRRGKVVDPWLLENASKAAWPPGPAPRFPTRSGKIELSSTILPRFGLPALPRVELPEAPSPELPLRLVTGPRQRAYINSQFHQLPSIERLLPAAEALIHPSVAEALGIAEGRPVRVVTAGAEAVFRAKLSPTVTAEVVVVPSGWSKMANANRLTTVEGLDPISGFPRLRGLWCRLERVDFD